MRKVLKLSSIVILFAMLFTLVGCESKITQKYADEINEKAKTEEKVTYAEIENRLGAPTIDARIFGVGVCTWISGITAEEYSAMTAEFIKTGSTDAYKNAKGKSGIIVTINGGNATSATYSKNAFEENNK